MVLILTAGFSLKHRLIMGKSILGLLQCFGWLNKGSNNALHLINFVGSRQKLTAPTIPCTRKVFLCSDLLTWRRADWSGQSDVVNGGSNPLSTSPQLPTVQSVVWEGAGVRAPWRWDLADVNLLISRQVFWKTVQCVSLEQIILVEVVLASLLDI